MLDTRMFGNAFMNRMFRQVDGVVWDLMTGKLGVQTDEGIITYEKDADGEPQINLNLFDQFGVALPALNRTTHTNISSVTPLTARSYTMAPLPSSP